MPSMATVYYHVARAELVNDTEAGGKKAHWGGGATRVNQLRTGHRRKQEHSLHRPAFCDRPCCQRIKFRTKHTETN